MFIALNSRCGERSSGAPCNLQKTHMSLLTERGRLCGTFVYKHAAPPELGQVSQVCHCENETDSRDN